MIKRTFNLLTLTLLTACQTAAPSRQSQGPTDLPSYAAAMCAILQEITQLPPAIAATGVSATTYIQILVKPDGEEIAARISRSSGIPVIDQIVFAHVTQAVFPPFPPALGTQPREFTIPFEVRPFGVGS
jgi:protein TonB